LLQIIRYIIIEALVCLISHILIPIVFMLHYQFYYASEWVWTLLLLSLLLLRFGLIGGLTD